MLDARARIVVEAVARQAIAEFAKTGLAIKGVTDETKKQAPVVNSLKQGWTSFLGPLAAATAAIFTVKKAIDFARAGAEVEELRGAFNDLAKTAGTTGDQIVAAIRRGADGTIAEMDAISTATRVMNLGIAESPAQFEMLANVAETLGDRLGLNTAQSIDNVAQALTTLAPRMIRSAGLTADADAVWAAYANTLGIAVGELTDAQKRTALLEDANRRLGSGTSSTADSYDNLSAAVTDFKTNLQVAVSVGVEPYVLAMANLSSAITGTTVVAGRLPPLLELTTRIGQSGGPVMYAFGQGVLALSSAIASLIRNLPSAISLLKQLLGLQGGGGGGRGQTWIQSGVPKPKVVLPSEYSQMFPGHAAGGRLGDGVSLVGEVGPELVINDVVIPTSITRQLLKLGLVPGNQLATGGSVFIDGTTAAPRRTSAFPSKGPAPWYATSSDGGGGGGGSFAAAATQEAVAETAAQAAAAEIAPAVTSAVIASQAAGQQAAADIRASADRTVAATEETNNLLRALLEVTERQGDAAQVGRSVRDALGQVEG